MSYQIIIPGSKAMIVTCLKIQSITLSKRNYIESSKQKKSWKHYMIISMIILKENYILCFNMDKMLSTMMKLLISD